MTDMSVSAWRRWSLAAVALAVGLGAGCPEDFPQKPQIRVPISPDNPFNFDATFVGTSRQSTVAITNKGLDDLVISSLTLTGDSAFHKYSPTDGTTNPTLMTVAANKTSYFAIVFAPGSATSFTGNVNIQSNAENTPSLDIPVLGTGVNP
jgi:centrosomal CEP192-like protein